MSQPNNPHPPQHVPYGQTNVYITPQPTNGLGIAGFITSLVGLVSCGILSPIGFLLSLFGMFKRPRGFAIAGVVLGALGSFFMVFFGLAIVAGLVGLGAAGKAIGEEFTTMSNAVQASAMIEDSKKENGFLPSDKDGTALISGKQDAWQNSFRYKKTGTETYKIISAGNDGIFDTDDDSSYDSTTLNSSRGNPGPSTMPFNPFEKLGPNNAPSNVPTH